ncbi:MAG: zinc ABC transporter substrate-binding protein [Planctomycetes bacterium]|nr:zinc ABC transporter substrate-binding protein [Planctomycetota bacterium]
MSTYTRRTLSTLVLLAAPAFGGLAGDPLRVVTTIPDLADLVREIGGERVEVSSIARGKENLHAVSARPSHLVAMSKADLFVEIGRSLEVAFVPGLLEGARNQRIRPGAPGFVNVSEGWEFLDVPAELSRKAGDVHPQGNPHLNLDPRAGRHMAERVLTGLVRVDPDSKDAYQARFEAYCARLSEAEARWKAQAAGWTGRAVVVYHQEFNYLASASGLAILASVEPKPGIPPTPNHVARVIADMKAQGCKVILTAPWSNDNNLERVAEATGATIVELPNQCGAVKGSETWISMMDVIHQRIGSALSAPR